MTLFRRSTASRKTSLSIPDDILHALANDEEAGGQYESDLIAPPSPRIHRSNPVRRAKARNTSALLLALSVSAVSLVWLVTREGGTPAGNDSVPEGSLRKHLFKSGLDYIWAVGAEGARHENFDMWTSSHEKEAENALREDQLLRRSETRRSTDWTPQERRQGQQEESQQTWKTVRAAPHQYTLLDVVASNRAASAEAARRVEVNRWRNDYLITKNAAGVADAAAVGGMDEGFASGGRTYDASGFGGAPRLQTPGQQEQQDTENETPNARDVGRSLDRVPAAAVVEGERAASTRGGGGMEADTVDENSSGSDFPSGLSNMQAQKRWPEQHERKNNNHNVDTSGGDTPLNRGWDFEVVESARTATGTGHVAAEPASLSFSVDLHESKDDVRTALRYSEAEKLAHRSPPSTPSSKVDLTALVAKAKSIGRATGHDGAVVGKKQSGDNVGTPTDDLESLLEAETESDSENGLGMPVSPSAAEIGEKTIAPTGSTANGGVPDKVLTVVKEVVNEETENVSEKVLENAWDKVAGNASATNLKNAPEFRDLVPENLRSNEKAGSGPELVFAVRSDFGDSARDAHTADHGEPSEKAPGVISKSISGIIQNENSRPLPALESKPRIPEAKTSTESAGKDEAGGKQNNGQNQNQPNDHGGSSAEASNNANAGNLKTSRGDSLDSRDNSAVAGGGRLDTDRHFDIFQPASARGEAAATREAADRHHQARREIAGRGAGGKEEAAARALHRREVATKDMVTGGNSSNQARERDPPNAATAAIERREINFPSRHASRWEQAGSRNAQVGKPPSGVDTPATLGVQTGLLEDGDERQNAGRAERGGGGCRLEGRVENWEPSATADLRASYEWKDEKKASIENIKKFNRGGEALRELIHKEVVRLDILRHDLFC